MGTTTPTTLKLQEKKLAMLDVTLKLQEKKLAMLNVTLKLQEKKLAMLKNAAKAKSIKENSDISHLSQMSPAGVEPVTRATP